MYVSVVDSAMLVSSDGTPCACPCPADPSLLCPTLAADSFDFSEGDNAFTPPLVAIASAAADAEGGGKVLLAVVVVVDEAAVGL